MVNGWVTFQFQKSTVKESYRLNIKKITRTSDVPYIFFPNPNDYKNRVAEQTRSAQRLHGLLIYQR